ncbi:hypothetical protein [uncultured Leifsonia sp.]|uniref:hypothetical protein n=1 Tax=uncultured Leifsonia sp. TaxID=340359 RepID=UPI0028D6B372|nr:hypothetical protein [uncultured Leifsonia sp.]
MRKHRRPTMPNAAIIGLAILALSGTGIQAATGSPEADASTADRPGLIAETRPLPPGVSTDPLPADQDSGLPDGIQDGLWDVYAAHPQLNVNTLEWDSSRKKLKVYTAAAAEVRTLFAKHLGESMYELIPAEHSKAAIDEVLSRISAAGGDLGNGQRVVTARPAKDGSSIALGIEVSSAAKRLAAPMDVARVLDSDIPLTVEAAPELAPVMRNIGYYVNLFSGAIMTRPASPTTIQMCTTGFRITHISSNAPAMLSADHCGRGNIGSNWYYSTVQSAEATLGKFGGMLSVAPPGASQVDTGIWTGGNTGAFYPAVFNGTNDGNSTLTAIRGAVIPVVNSSVCHSGARSGNICGNTVTATGQLFCYSPVQCYSNQSTTQQTSNIPAVGKGDSGGPVYQSLNGQPYGAGVISGMLFPNDNCTGDPADANRTCSAQAIYAPLNNALGSNGWGFKYVP